MPRVELRRLAHARSGDKGDTANVGVIAYSPAAYRHLKRHLTPERVAEHFAGMIDGPVERFDLDNLEALNFLLHDVLGGGGVASIRNDPQGKGYAQLLLSCPIPVPKAIAESLP